jgi:hypothetical protein
MAERDDRGRFLPGHPPLPGGGRPPGAVNKLSRSLREEVLDGVGDVAGFVHELKSSHPQACAGLLAKLLPSEPIDESSAAGGTVNFTICAVSVGHQVQDGLIVTGPEAYQAWQQRLEEERLQQEAEKLRQLQVRRELGFPDPPAAVERLEVLEVDMANVTKLKPHG